MQIRTSTAMVGAVLAGLAMAGWGLQARAEGLATPQGPVILTVTGLISNTNTPGAAAFDRAMLEDLGMVDMATTTIWTEGVQQFQGVPLAALLTAIGASGARLQVTALNEYTIDIPVSDVGSDGPFLALTMNGVALSSRDKGPIWVVYPYDHGAQYQQQIIYARSIWQLVRIEVLP